MWASGNGKGSYAEEARGRACGKELAMSVFRYKGSKVWTMDFMFHGQRIRESTGTRSKTLAKKIEDKRRQKLEEGAGGIRKQQAPRILSVAGEEWLEVKRPGWSPGMFTIAKTALRHLDPILGKQLLVDIEAKDISRYQKSRLSEGASERTINIEIGVLRQIARKHGTWARIQSDVQMLAERQDVGRALTAAEEAALLLECGKSRSRILLPFVVLALETGARYNTIRTLLWGNIDLASRCLKIGKDKTAAGTGRTVPLNQRAVEVLKFWSQQFPNRLPQHCLFPAEKVGAAGDHFDAKVYETDPSKPVGEIKEAWESAKKRTRRHCPHCKTGTLADQPKPAAGFVCIDCRAKVPELPAGLCSIRFHDLRHTAVSRMIAARIPLPIIAKIVGWSDGTMAKMAARYGHFGIEDLRFAVESISRGEIDSGSPVFSPVSESPSPASRAN
jgi:integrase